MANRDYLFRAKADTSNYDANLAKASQTLNKFQKENYSAGGVIKQMTSQLVVSAAKFASFGAAVSGAMKLTKDAFMASEASVDEWGRTMAASKSLYEGFLTSLNTGDISGFLSRIDQIVSAARAAYDELDKLGSMQTIQAPKVSAQQAEIQRMQAMLRTGRYIAPAAGSGMKASGESGRLLTPQEMKNIQQHLQNGMDNMVSLVGREVKQTGVAIDAIYARFGKELGMSEKEFREGTSSWAAFTKRMELANRYRQWENANSSTSVGMSGGLSVYGSGGSNPYAAYKGWDVFRVDGERYKELVQLIQQRDAQAASMYGQQANAYRAINRADSRINGRGGGGGRGGSGSLLEGGVKGLAALDGVSIRTTESMKDLQDQLSQFREALASATNAAEYNAAAAGISDTQQRIAVQGSAMRLGVSTGSFLDMNKRMNDSLRSQLQPITFDKVPEEIINQHEQAAKEVAGSWQDAAQAVNSVGSALAGLKSPAARVAGIVGQAIANIALGFSKAMDKEGDKGVWFWIASAASGLATMISTISAIKSATSGYADGGIVKGNTYSGDQIYGGAFVNAGELVLNRAQQSTLASALQGGGSQGGSNSQPYVSGEQIYLGLNNYLARSGRGELITTR
jgi:hypothetical protein